MSDRPETAFRSSFLAWIETPDDHAVVRRFGELLVELLFDGRDAVMVPSDQQTESDARRYLAAAAADLRWVMEALSSLIDFAGGIDDARAKVAAHDALAALEPIAAKLEATFGEGS